MDNENKNLIWLIGLVLLAGIVLTLIEKCSTEAQANEPVEQTQPYNLERDVQRVDAGIKHLLRKVPYWGLSADKEARARMAIEIVSASYTYQIPPLLLTVMVKRESSFDPKAIGESRGEVGLLQVHAIARRGCRLDTIAGQLACGASWLRRAYETCDEEWRGAITMFMSGRCGARNGSKLHTAVSSRLRQWSRLESL